MSAATLRKTIFAGCRSLGLDDDARRDLQVVATGKDSLTAMSEAELTRVVEVLRQKGFKAKASAKPRHKPAPRADLRLVHVLWRKLGEAGALKRPGRAGLNAFIRSRFEGSWGVIPADVDMLREHAQIDQLVEALKAMGKRADIDFDWGHLNR